jgi:two-component system OmpR family sensor kinase
MNVNKFSLRTRLIAVVVAVTIFALTAGGTATWLALRASLYNRLNNDVEQQAGGASNSLQGQLDRGHTQLYFNDGPPGAKSRSTTLILVLDSSGRQRTLLPLNPGSPSTVGPDLDPAPDESDAVPTLKLSSDDLSRLAATNGDPISLITTDGKEVHATWRPLHDEDGEPLIAFVGIPTVVVDDTLTQLLLLELVVGGGAVLVAIGLGAYGVRAGLGPLTRVTSTAHEIAQNLSTRGSGLERRVPEGDPETEVGRLTDALNTMLSAAQAAYAVRVENEARMRRFLADASHELRTPLTSLRGYAELERLRTAAGAEDPDATKDALRRIESEGDRMAKLVDDLLLLARADAAESDGDNGAIALGPVQVAEVVGEAIDRARAAHPGREFRIDGDGTGLVAHADYETLLQVLGNLLRNAAIHTPGPRPIRIGARLDRGGSGTEDRAAAVTIADEGPGMSSDQADHAFDRFWRADSGRTRATGGSGLGLPIVHALVEAQHGSVSLFSRPDTGTTVTVRLPLESLERNPIETVGRLAYRGGHAPIRDLSTERPVRHQGR